MEAQTEGRKEGRRSDSKKSQTRIWPAKGRLGLKPGGLDFPCVCLISGPGG